MADTIKPMSQGRLDALCSLYCVVNAVRLASFPELRIGRGQSKKMIDAIARTLGGQLARIFEHGTNDLRPILRAADNWLLEAHGQSLHFTRPFRDQKPTPKEVKDVISSHLSNARSTAIVCTTLHWTVIQCVTAKRYVLFDSDGLSHFRLDKQKRRHANQILPQHVFLISLQPH